MMSVTYSQMVQGGEKKCVCVEREERGRQTLAVNELGERCIWVFSHCSCSFFICLKLFQNREFKCSLRKYEEVL